MQGQHQVKTHANLNSESVWFKAKLISQFLTLSFLLTQPFYLSYLHAAPIGGEVVGGTGSISQTDLTTTINQSSQNLAIDWQSFDVNVDERVQFIQPNTSSIALNRILSNNGSTIQGQIDANGQVILVNPNGVFFSSTATVNVGGLIASSLDIAPSDFMNGNYIFNEVLGTEGSVINSGIINASVGGNVALLGKQVKNDGLISANLGSVVLAAGKQSILTFDSQGLIGVKVTKEVLQEEIGIEEAVINNGDINAAGGRVLLTASTSQDVFSQVVNNTSIDQATSVVVHEDGSFTLGGGADVLNTGSIDVSSETNSENIARIILLGENVTSSGSINADTQNGNAGEIEIHANDKALLTHNSITSAQGFESGQGGLIKILGDKVGLFDASEINASGTNGGGEVLFGGDRQGLNSSVRNSSFIYLGENTIIKADATDNGNGGKIITFAKDTARIYGDLYARGGLNGGNGGFIETSGLKGFEITNTPDVTSSMGLAGEWLIDPYNITIVAGDGSSNISTTGIPTFESSDYDATLGVELIQTALSGGTSVTIETSSDGNTVAEGAALLPQETGNDGNITLDTHLNFHGSGNATLTLKAENNITISNGRYIIDGTPNDGDQLNLNLYAKGIVDIESLANINTQGGNFTVGDGSTYNPSSFINSGTINTTGYIYNAGTDLIPNITRVDSGAIDIQTATSNGTIQINSTGSLVTDGGVVPNEYIFWGEGGFSGGDITLLSGVGITINGTISSKGSSGQFDPYANNAEIGGAGGAVSITSSTGNIEITQEINTSGGRGDGDSDTGSDADPGNGGAGGTIDIIATSGSVALDKLTSTGGDAQGSDYIPSTGGQPTGGIGGDITIFSGGSSGITLNDIIDTSGGVPTKGPIGDDADEKGIVGDGGSVDIVANSVDVLINAGANIITGGGNVTVGDTSGTPVLPSSFTNNAEIKTTGGTNLAAGNITIDSAGSISTGTLTAKGGTTDKAIVLGADGIVGQNGGVVTLNAQDTINVDGVIDTTGSQGDFTNGDVGQNGGVGGNININSTASVDVTANFDSSGGAGAGDASEPANGGNAGSITIDINDNFDLTANLIAEGGAKAGGSASDGADNTITINGDDSANTFTIGTGLTLTGSIIKINGFDANDTFAIGSTIKGSTSELIDGGTGNDTFEFIDKKLSTTILGGDGLDTVLTESTDNKPTLWTIDATNAGNLVNDGVGKSYFTEVENLTGNPNTDTFDFTADGWIDGLISGGGSADTLTVTTFDYALTVQLGTDFTSNPLSDTELNVDAVETITANSSFENTLIGINVDSIWTITNDSEGNVKPTTDSAADNTVKFIDFFNLTANSSLDEFTFDKNGWINGLILGGINDTTTEKDTLNIEAIGTTTVQLGTEQTSISDFVLNVDQFETITATASPNPSSTLIGNNAANTWTITGSNSGTLKPTTGSADQNTVEFNNFINLTGNVDVDDFTIETGGWVNGLISGGDNTTLSNLDTLDITALDATTVQLGISGLSDLILNVDQIESISANSSVTNILRSENVASSWLIDDVNSGSLALTAGADAQNTVAFNDFSYLEGSTAADIFTFDTAGTIADIDGGTGDFNTLIGRTADTTWNITDNNSGDLEETSLGTYVANFSNIQNLLGQNGDDTFVFADNFTIDGLIDGQGHSAGDSFDISAITTDRIITIDDLVGVNNIEFFVGNGINHTLEASDISNTWTIGSVTYQAATTDGVNDGTLNGSITFVDVNTIKGGAADDTFNFSGVGSIDNIVGGVVTTDTATFNTINARDVTNTWNITDIDTGNLNETSANSYVSSFSSIQNLNGGNEVDEFTFTDTGSWINGLITGGDNLTLSVLDTIDITALGGTIVQLGSVGIDNAILNVDQIETISANSAVTNILRGENTATDWLIDDVNSGSLAPTAGADAQNSVAFNDFSNLEGGTAADIFMLDTAGTIADIDGGTTDLSDISTFNTIVGRDKDNTWNITGNNSGNLEETSLSTYITSFSNVQNLTGGDSDDAFVYEGDFTISGLIDGRTHNNNGGDSVDVSDIITERTFTIGSLVGFTNIESIIGNNDNHTLQATDGTNLWLFDGANSGTLTSGGNVLSFVDFNQLIGGSGEDTFRFTETSSFIGTIDAAGGIDFVDYSLYETDPNIDVNGAPSIIFHGVTNAEGIIGNNSTSTLNTGTGSTTSLWTIEQVAYNLDTTKVTDNANDGSVNGIYFINFNNLTGNDGEDTFRFAESSTITGTVNAGLGMQQIQILMLLEHPPRYFMV